MGWDDIDKITAKNNDTLNKFERLACEVFTTVPGKQLMELLIDQFLYGVVASPQDAASYAYWREGQNSLIRRFLNAINKKQQQTPPITPTIQSKQPEEKTS